MKTSYSLMARFVAIVCIIFNLNLGGGGKQPLSPRYMAG
jgi:hypothetical protein